MIELHNLRNESFGSNLEIKKLSREKKSCVCALMNANTYMWLHVRLSAVPSAAMVELDGDDIRISSRGKLAERDIVQVTHIITCKLY